MDSGLYLCEQLSIKGVRDGQDVFLFVFVLTLPFRLHEILNPLLCVDLPFNAEWGNTKR